MVGRLSAVAGMCALAVMFAGSQSAPVAAPQETPALGGGWRLNVEASTNPNGPPGQARASRGSRGGGAGGGLSGSGNYAANASSATTDTTSLSPQEQARFDTMKTWLWTAPPLLGFRVAPSEVQIVLDPQKGPSFTQAANNKNVEFATPAGEMQAKIKWDKGKLRREIETRDTLHVVEEYAVSADGKQLVVTIKTDSRVVRNVQTADIIRVYDRVQ